MLPDTAFCAHRLPRAFVCTANRVPMGRAAY